MTSEKRSSRKPTAWLSLGVLVASIALLAWFAGRDLDALAELRSVAPIDVVLIFVLQGLYLLAESYRQQVVVEAAANQHLPTWTWFRIFVIGRFLNRFVPQSGNVYRALRLRAEFGIGYVDFVGAMVLFLMMGLGLNLGLAASLMAIWDPDASYGPLSAPWALGITATLVIVLPVLLGSLLRRVPIPPRPVFGPVRVLSDLLGSASDALHRGGLVLRFAATWAATVALVVALYGVIFSTLGVAIGIGEMVVLYALLQLTSFVVLTPGNLGIQELGFVGLGALFGVPLAQGAAAAAIIRITGWIVLAIATVVVGSGDVRDALTKPGDRDETADSRSA